MADPSNVHLMKSLCYLSFSNDLLCFQVNEIYHGESLGVHINVVLVRMIMLGYAKVKCPKICEV